MRFLRRSRQSLAALVASLALLPCAEPARAGLYTPFHIPEARTASQVKASPGLCRPLVVYASRGSDENSGDAKYYSGLGEELRPIYYAIADLYGAAPPAPTTPAGTTATPHPALLLVTNRAPAPNPAGDPYPATETDPLGPGLVLAADQGGYGEADYLGYRARGADLEDVAAQPLSTLEAYNASAVDGGRAAARDIRKLLSACPTSKLLLLGYSEGAEVTRRAIATLATDGVNPGGRVKTMLFGDVLWKGNEPNVTHVGDTAGDLRGGIRRIAEGIFDYPNATKYSTAVSPIPDFPSGWDVTTWCHGGDLACQFPAGTLIAHTNYDQEDRVGASMRAAEWAGGAITKPILTAKLSTPLHCVNWWGTYRERLTITSPITTSGEFVGSYEPSLGPAFNRTTLTVNADADPEPEVATANPSIVNLWLPTSQRFKVTWNGHKLDYRNRC